MFAIAGWLIDAVQWLVNNAVGIVWSGIVDCVNEFFAGCAGIVTILFAALPSMSDAPSIGTGQWLAWLNWFFPVGTVLSGAALIIVMYVTFLGIRWALNFVRAL